MGQIADACHVFARFVDVRLAKLLIECCNLVVSVGMIVAHFFGRLWQSAVGQTGLHGQFVAIAFRAGETDVSERISGDGF